MKITIPRFNIFAEGCTAALAEREDEIPDAVNVAVNMALELCDKHTIDVWAMTDRPQILFKYIHERHHPHQRVVWGLNNWRDEWLKLGWAEDSLYLTDPWLTLMRKPTGEDDDKVPSLPTIFVTILQALGHGARHIRLFGVDMKGTGSPFRCFDPWRPHESESIAVRWRKERQALAHAMRQCRKVGCRIERWRPRHLQPATDLVSVVPENGNGRA